jgi:beta-galactosidase|tara:strand:- start:10892 stop:12787 length:1896 start_codon:yes stop_codon:yes gene_type:complete
MMSELGLTYVRIAEFAWSRIEPRDGEFQFEWLDNAVETLANAGLSVVMCTPTATPPKWLVDKFPEILPVDPDTGRTRGFGSRRHYDFSSDVYFDEAMRITELMAKRYGKHDAIVGWQTDNEICCHNTNLSASDVARSAFQQWCSLRYASIDALNDAWGNVFWSMEYQNFSAIELPVGAVTETNPAHRLAYRRFSSEKVCHFNDSMTKLIRAYAPGKFVTHNFMPMTYTGVDNYSLAAPLDFSSHDSYPLGRVDQQLKNSSAEELRKYMRTGHPDASAYSHDQTRGFSKDPFWVMEQQPGPVNWADNNARPAPGMIRLWTLEAFAHGAGCVSYFRWRQALFGQEQMHAGLLRQDNSKSAAWPEVEEAIADVAKLSLLDETKQQADVAMITAAESVWVSAIERQSESYEFANIEFDYYHALRSLGVSVDFVNPDSDLSGYKLVIAPGLPIIGDALIKKFKASDASFIFGPRSGAKTSEFSFPGNLPPGELQQIAPLRVLSIETLRPDCIEGLCWNGKRYESLIWREELEVIDGDVLAQYDDGLPAVVRCGSLSYIGTLTDTLFLKDFFRMNCQELGIETNEFGIDLRIIRRGNLMFAFNYSEQKQDLPLDKGAQILLGSRSIKPHDVTVWKRN